MSGRKCSGPRCRGSRSTHLSSSTAAHPRRERVRTRTAITHNPSIRQLRPTLMTPTTSSISRPRMRWAWARLLNSATYFSQDNIRTNGGYFIPIAPPPATPPLSILDPRSEQPQTSTNNELRLTSADTGPWNWTLGGVYRNFHYSLEQLPPYVGFTGSPGTGLPAPLASAFDYRGASTSWAAFADTSYLISGVVTVGAGVRSYHDTEYYNSGGEQSASFQSVDPRFYVNWKINERLNAYASAAKGFRSGGFNAVQQTGFAPESVWTYEVGSKGIAPDIGMTFAADLFYSNYKNYVVAGIPLDNPLVNDYQNAGSALIKGVEFDSQWQLPGGWTLGVNGDFLDAYFTSIELQPASSPYLLGDHLDLVPKYQGTVTFQRDFAFQGHKGYVLADYGIQGRSTYRNRSIGDWYLQLSPTSFTCSISRSGCNGVTICRCRSSRRIY